MTDRLLIRDCTLLSKASAPLLMDYFVTVEGSQVASLGPMVDCPDTDGFQVIEARSKLLMPGLVQGHTGGLHSAPGLHARARLHLSPDPVSGQLEQGIAHDLHPKKK